MRLCNDVALRVCRHYCVPRFTPSVCEKSYHYTFVYNFAKCSSIFTILSLTGLKSELVESTYLSLSMSLRYLVNICAEKASSLGTWDLSLHARLGQSKHVMQATIQYSSSDVCLINEKIFTVSTPKYHRMTHSFAATNQRKLPSIEIGLIALT